jgi:hypothetical protein
MEFKEWLDKAWEDHATDAGSVASRIVSDGATVAKSSNDIEALARLAHHVYGEHLARFDEGRACLSQLRSHEHGAAASPLLSIFDASFALSANDADEPASFDEPTRIRITALAAGNLVAHSPARARALLSEAVASADKATLDDRDAACRALAIAGNQIACTIEQKPARTEDERALMIFAAQTARRYWARAGGWLEIERAEYRLAEAWRHAGDFVEARRHAQQCLEIVNEHGAPALEAFFGWEALALAERDAGHAAGHARARANAREAFERLEDDDRKWCEPSLMALGS